MKASWLTCVALLCPVFAQNPAVVTRAGYTSPELIRVAPGQVITLFVRPGSIDIKDKAVAEGSPWPTQLAGIAVELKQTLSETALRVPVLSVVPTRTCAAVTPAACPPRLGITIQMPFELVPNIPGSRLPANFATLTVFENGVAGDPFPVSSVPDQIHIVNACDTTLTALPDDGVCTAAVKHADGTTVTSEKPAKADELLTVDVYGLGYVETNPASGSVVASNIPVSGVSLGMEFAANAAAVKPQSDQTVQPESVNMVAGSVGVYRITFRVPVVPQGTPTCSSSVESNLTVSIARTSSFAGVGICTEP